ncbi:hypothetical protein Asppvi_005218 [Aspergillus pseudoviridinutans]|uniref:Endo-1,3(4)-beta-glucanase n=1 Tax=Aspergillus pseudoviridinutans TaxID=1517512 RepID=A0A9P3BEP4_9EURO|nr:uncharacterized protein Asppvi_005218 [Aspergillus pseudoviridinutans]GIJ86331.1 hypothetical protein Asppvi_005218 [Aspergillus pseudoviridinutans]
MVLNDTSPQSESEGSYAPSQNGSNSYTSGHIPIPGYPLVLKTEYLSRPDPFTLYFGFVGQRNWLHKNGAHVRDRIESCKVMINRLPTQEELDAFVYHGSKYIYHQRLGAPYCGAIGMAYVYWRVRNSGVVAHLAPGLKPGQRPSPAQVLAAVKLYSTIEPANFRQLMVWGSFRWFFWVAAGSVITSVWGMFHDLKETMGDPRLKQFFAEMKDNDPEEVRRRKVQRVVEKTKAAREAAERRAQGLPPVEPGMGQGVGAGGGGYAESHEHDQDGGTYGSLDPYSSSSARETVESASSDKPANLPDRNLGRLYGDPSATQSMRGATTVDQNKTSDFFESDDASPVAAEYRSDGGSQGSAWDRIRQQASSGSQGGQDSGLGSAWNRSVNERQQREQDSGLGSAWNRGSSSPDSDSRQREQAQAEFDRLLEAERNMAGDSQGGEKKGWGRWN